MSPERRIEAARALRDTAAAARDMAYVAAYSGDEQDMKDAMAVVADVMHHLHESIRLPATVDAPRRPHLRLVHNTANQKENQA